MTSYAVEIEVEGAVVTARNARGGSLAVGKGEGAEFTPVELLLAAIGACSALDVTTVLERRRQPLSALRIEVGATRAEDARLEKVTVRYLVPEGQGASDADLEVARRTTAEVLCTVSRTVEHGAPVEHEMVRADASVEVDSAAFDAAAFDAAASAASEGGVR